MPQNPALEDLYARKSVSLKPCLAEIKGVELMDPSIPSVSQRVSLSQPSYGYGEFHIEVTLPSQHSPEARRVTVAKITVCSKYFIGEAEQREFSLGGPNPPPSLQAFAGGAEPPKYVRVRVSLLRRGVKILFFPAVSRNNDTERIKSSLRAFQSSLQKPSPNTDPITLDLFLMPGDAGFRDKIAMIDGIIAVVQTPAHPGAALLLAQPGKVLVDRDALLADFESSAEKDIGHRERPEPQRVWFWDAADRSVCLARAEVGAHQLKLQHNSAVMGHHVRCAAVGVKGTRVNGVRGVYMLYVNTDAPHLLPSQGESCSVRFRDVKFTAPQPPKPPSDVQKLRAIATLMTDLFYDGPSPLTPAAKDTPAFVRAVYCALARFDNREPEHACANIKEMGWTDFDRLRQSNQSFSGLYRLLLPGQVTHDGVTTWRRPKGIYYDTVIKVVRNQPHLLRLPTYDYASGGTPLFVARRVHLQDALQGQVSAAFIAYAPAHKIVVAHAGDGYDEVLGAGHFDFHLGDLDTADRRDLAQCVADSSRQFRCSIIPQSPDDILAKRLNAIDAAAGQALTTDTGRYLLEYTWNGQYQDNVTRLPALNLLVNQLNCAPEACISEHFLGLDSNQRKIFSRAADNFGRGTLSILGAPGTGKTHAVLVLVLAALMVKGGGRVAIVCDNEKRADHFASRLRTMAGTTPNKLEPGRSLEDGILRVGVIAESDKRAPDVIDEVLTMHIAARTGGRRAEHGEPSSLVARVGALINDHPSHSGFRNDLIARAAELCTESDFRGRCRNYVVKIMAGLLDEARAIVTTAVGLNVIRQNATKVLDDVSLIVYPQAADLSETSRLMSEVACPNAIVRVLEGSLLEAGLGPGPGPSPFPSSAATTTGRIARARHQSTQMDVSALVRSFDANGAVVNLHTDHRHLGGQTALLNKLFCGGRLETPRLLQPNPAQAVSQKLVRAVLGTPNARTNVVAWDLEHISDPEIYSRFWAPPDMYQGALEKAMFYFVRMVMLFGVSAEDDWKRPTVAIVCADDDMAHLMRGRMRKLPTSEHVPSLVHVLTLAEAVGREFDYAMHLTARDSDQAGYIGGKPTMVVGITRARLATVTVFTSTGLTNKPRDKNLREFIKRLVEDGCLWTPALKTFSTYCLECGYTRRNRDLGYCGRDHRLRGTPMGEALSIEQHEATKGPIRRTEQMMD
ncbi:hypothetical protein RB594_006246 [Gaeumannomyces avenae]